MQPAKIPSGGKSKANDLQRMRGRRGWRDVRRGRCKPLTKINQPMEMCGSYFDPDS